MAGNPSGDRYSHTPRKVFDKAIDRIEVKRLRDREDHRNDLQTIFQKLKELKKQLSLLDDLSEQHEDDVQELNRRTEGL